MEEFIQASISGVALLSLLGSALALNAPDSYMPLNGLPIDLSSKSKLKVLNVAVIVGSLIQISSYAWLIHPIFDQIEIAMIHYVLLTSWIVLLLVSTRLNKPQNAYVGGHFAIFIALLLLVGVHISKFSNLFASLPIEWSTEQVLAVSQTGFTFVLISVIGFWTNRSEADDEEMISTEKGASIFSQLLFNWTTPLLVSGAENPLKDDELWGLIEDEKSDYILADYYLLNQNDSLAKKVFLLSLRQLLYQYACCALSAVLEFSGPYFLYQITSMIQDPNIKRIEIVPQLLGLFGFNLLKAIVSGQEFFIGRRVGTRGRVAIIDEIYKKSLHRVQGASADDEKASLGKIVTLMSVDTEQIRMMLSISPQFLIAVPISIAVSISSLYLVVGWSAIVGILIVLFIIPLSKALAAAMIKYQKERLENTGKRVAAMNEMLQGIRIVKYFGWENHFLKKIGEIRVKELNSIMRLWAVFIGLGTLGSGSGIFISFATFAVYALIAGNNLDARTAFTAVYLLGVVSQSLTFLPAQVAQVLKAKVSLDRIQDYLKEQDIDKYTSEEPLVASNSKTTIGFKNAELRYHGNDVNDSNSINFTLRNVNVEFPTGKLSVIAGSTGSGKTSLLLGLLGELKLESGEIFFPSGKNRKVNPVTGLCGTVAFAAQNAWLLNATIRENILFGEPYDEKRYNSVIRDCALAADLENLDGGDLTEIGEKGVNISGGQKQRISLARTCYARASYVLLDDPLSAVDAPTARFLLHKCIMGLLKGRTVILVSHATNLVIPFADLVVVMKNGEIAASGPPIEITNSVEDETVFGISLEKDIFDDEKEGFSTDDGQIAATIAGGGTGLIKKEEQTTGSVSPKLYRKYFAATGGFGFLLLFFGGFILASASNFGKDWWLHVWTDANNANIGLHTFGIPNFSPEYTFSEMQNPIQPLIQRPFPTNSIFESEPTQNGQLFYIGVYALFGLLFILATTVRTIVRLVGSLWASRKLHDELLKSILYSPLRFFEVTPVGRILNRFSSDIEKIDVQVLQAVAIFSNQVIQGVTIIVIIGSMAPTFLLMVPFITFFFLKVAKLYLYSSRELKRIESTSRSPIYSQFSETLAGVCTIRAYGAEERFQNLNLFKVDQNTKPYFLMWATNRWLSIRTDFLSNIVVMGAGCAIIFGELGPGWAALVLTYAMQFTNALVWTIRFHAEMEMAMNSVERVQEYCEIDQEPPAIIESNRPSSEWPQHGAIQVRDLSIRYAEDLPDVLQGVSFEVLANEKVAVVGRTGAGKSTLSLAFFRIISLSGGSITIDGENISNLGLHDLRSKLTIIPQDPVLFTGDLRSNLDPFDQHDEPKIWEALKGVHFLESLQQKKANDPQSLTEGEAASVIDPNTITLDYKVQENGGNFSQGQRQLLCLARSLLQGNKIIFLDEATASVDNDTDAKIQATIRTEFADRTIICIAHRLRTIIDYDKVLVLDKGKVIEFGTPLNLIEQNGTFRSMCEDTGEFQELVELAKNGSANGFNK